MRPHLLLVLTGVLHLAIHPMAAAEDGARVLTLAEAVAISASSVPVELAALQALASREDQRAERWRLLPNLSAQAVVVRADPYLAVGGTAVDVAPETTLDARLRLGQAILDLESWHRLRAAGDRAAGAAADHRSARERAAADAAAAYVALTSAARLAAIRRGDLALADELLALARERADAGAVEALAVTRAESRRAEALGARIAAEGEVDQASIALARLLALDVGASLRPDDAVDTDLARTLVPIDAGAALAEALRLRPELAAAAAEVAAAEADRRAEQGARLPRVDAFADAGRTGPETGDTEETWRVGLGLTVPLLDGGRHRARSAGHLAAQQRLRQVDLRRRIAAEVRAALVAVATAAALVEAAASERSLAEREIAQARERFAAGAAGNADLIDAQLGLARAGDRLVGARQAHALALVRVAHATGRATTLAPVR